ncbi:hypothetical protein JNL27_05595 [bacterium]|nr:hypothetical protein [bacterium]
MKKTLPIITFLFIFTLHLPAQTVTHIDPATLTELEKSCVEDEPLKAAQNAMAQTDGKVVSQNWEKIAGVDPYFSIRLKDQKITDQKSTGRCWMFSGLNIVRPSVTSRLNCRDIELSQAYLYFYEKLEKANLFLNAIIETRKHPYTERSVENLMKQVVQDGQNWHGFTALVKKYGVVPKDVMPETHSASSSAHVIHVLSLRLKQAAMKIRSGSSDKKIAEIKMQALKDVYRILVINFGTPPKEFTWRYMTAADKLSPLKTYTPQQFYRDAIGEELDDYYPLYSVPTLAFNKKFEIDLNRIISDQPNLYFVNCDLAVLKDVARKSVEDSTAVWFGCDVHQESNWDKGLMTPDIYDLKSLYGIDFTMTRKELFETYSSIPTHNMVFTGIDIQDGKVKKWLVENSWGDSKGKNGYFIMMDEWFDLYVQEVVVHKKYIPKDVMDAFKLKATTLPAWDPMMERVK